MLKIGTNTTHLCANEEVLTTGSYAYIHQNNLKYRHFTLGIETEYRRLGLLSAPFL